MSGARAPWLALALYLLAFAGAFPGLASRSWELTGDYDHLALIPVVGGVLLWRAWPRVAAGQGSASGLLLLAAALWLNACARVEEVLFPQVLGAWLGAVGLIACRVGWRGAWGLRFPLAFLLLALPPPRSAIDLATGGLKRLVTRVAVESLALLDVPAVARGTRILLHDGQVEVDDACSGLKGLLAFVAIGALLARESPRAWQRALLVAAALPAAFLANLVRVLVLTALALRWPELVQSDVPHALVGLAGYGLGFAALLGLQTLIGGDATERGEAAPVEAAPSIRAVGVATWVVLALGTLLAWALPLLAPRSAFAPPEPALEAGAWRGERVTLPVREPGAVYVRYRRPGDEAPTDLYLQQGEGSRVGLHVPQTCFPGEGFAPVSRQLTAYQVGGRPVTVAEEVWRRGSEAYLSVAWYRVEGADVPEPDFVRLRLRAWARRLILAHQGGLLLVRITTPLDPGARARAEGLAGRVLPTIETANRPG